MTGHTQMRAAVRTWIAQNPDIDPLDVHWVVPLRLRRELPEVRAMPGPENEVIVMVRAILVGWYLHGPGRGKLPPRPPEARDPRTP
jgi:hypothetical protein